MEKQQFHYSAPRFPTAQATCWYCDRQLNDNRRFCDCGCAEAFEQDDLAVERRLLAREPVSSMANA